MTLPADDGQFKWAVEEILRHEGGLVDHARDPGGITSHGISLRFALDATDLDKDGRLDLDTDGNGVVDAADIRTLSREDAIDVYRLYFWHPMGCNDYRSGIALMLFDCAVNQGRGAAIGILQRALGVKVDGKLGPITRAAVNAADEMSLLKEINARRAMRYAGTSNFDTFGLGWMRRLSDVHAAAVCVARGF